MTTSGTFRNFSKKCVRRHSLFMKAGADENEVGLRNISQCPASLAKIETRHNTTKLESVFQGTLHTFSTKLKCRIFCRRASTL